MKKNEKNYEGYVSYQAHITKVKEAKWSGRDGFSLNKVLQDIRGRCLDVAIVLTDNKTVEVIQYFCCNTKYRYLTLPLSHRRMLSW